MRTGRPPKYRKEMCAVALEQLKNGCSLAGVARALGVSRDTIYEWARKHKDFSDTIKRGTELSLAWWEDTLADQARGLKGSTAAAIFVLKNRWHNEYRDRMENEVSVHEISEKTKKTLQDIFAVTAHDT